jgi:anti-sigma regulatory factor (Ser/Thr protein kinase)
MTTRASDTAEERLHPPRSVSSFRHEALLYETFDTFVDGTVAFLEDGLAQDAATLVVVNAAKIEALRAALGPKADKVAFADMATVGANPSRIIPVWSDFVASHSSRGRPLRGIGEPIWAERTAAEMAECHIHESLLNLAFAETSTFWLLCPYDMKALDADALGGARRNHAFMQAGTDHRESAQFAPPTDDLFADPLPPAPAHAESLSFGSEDLPEIRRLVERRAVAAGLDSDRAADLLIAVNELATNSVVHGGGTGTLAVWRDGPALLCEVSDAGRFDRPLAGRVRPTVVQPSGRGLWLVNQLCDLVQVRVLAASTVVRVHQRLGLAV